MSRVFINATVLALVLACVPGCEETSESSSTTGLTTEAGVGGEAGTAGSSGAGGSGAAGVGGEAGAPPVKRTVIHRSPYAISGTAGDLMLDGTFETVSKYYNQWFWIAPKDPSLPLVAGARCRTGMQCMSIMPAHPVGLPLVSPRSGAIHFVLYARPESGACEAVKAYLIDCTAGELGPATAIPLTSKSAQDGWCELQGDTEAMPYRTPLLFVQATGTEVLIDDVQALPAASSSGSRAATEPPDAETLELMRETARRSAMLRDRGLPGFDGPANLLRSRPELDGR